LLFVHLGTTTRSWRSKTTRGYTRR